MPKSVTVEIKADTASFEQGVKKSFDGASANTRQFKTALDQSRESLSRFAKGASEAGNALSTSFASAARKAKELGDTLSNIGGKLSIGITAPLTALGVAAVKTATDFDSLKRGLIAVSGSAQAAEKQLVRLKEVAKLPGLGFKEAIQGSINLQAAGFNAERAEKALRAFGNALATVGKGKAELDGVILALSQIETKGKVSAEEINQLAERVPQIRQIMLRAFGTADTEVIQRAKITSKQFIDTVVTELAKLPQVTGGARNAFENLKDSIEQSLLPLGNKLLETILPAIEKLTPKILGLLEGFGKLSSETQQLAIGFGIAAIAGGPLIGALGNILKLLVEIRAIGGVGSVLGGVGRGALGFLGTPLGAVGAIGGAAALGVYLSNEELKERGEAFEKTQQRKRSGRPLLDATAAAQDRDLFAAASARDALATLNANGLNARLKVGGGLAALDPATGRFGSSASPADSPVIDAKKLAAENTKRQGQKTELQKAADNVKDMAEKVAALEAGEGALFIQLAKLDVLREKFEILEKKQKQRAFIQVRTELGLPLPIQLPKLSGAAVIARPPGLTAGGPDLNLAGSVARQQGAESTASGLDASRTRERELDQRLRIQEVQIQNQATAGLISETDARQKLNAVRAATRDEIIQTLEDQRKLAGANSIEGLQITEQIERTRLLGVELTNQQRFMKGFGSAVDAVGDSFEKFGQNVAGALTNTKDLLNGLKQALLGFFNDLLGRSIQGVVGQALAPLAQIFGGGVFGGGAGRAGGGGAGGVLGNIFRTPSYAGGQGLQSLAGIGLGAGFGIDVPASVSSGSIGNLPIFRGNITNPNAIASSTGGVISGAASQPSFLSGIGNSLAGAAPFIGAGIGSSLGGQSVTGQIAGAAGGLLAGGAIGAALTTNVFSATATAFLTNPFTIAAGAGLLVGAYFLGKASQRKKDEEASGQYLTQALQSIDQLASGVASGQIDGGQARQIFESQILGTFKQQISGLKTKSVVESRLTNQVRDLRKVFEDRIPPLIAEQQRKAADAARFGAIDSRLVPQFASGGFVGGIDRGRDSVMAMLRPGELVLNRSQQASVMAQSNPGVFSRAGVPAVNTTGRYADGGYAMPASGGGSGGTIVIDRVVFAIDSESIAITGMSGRNGEQVVINHIENVNLRKKR